MTLDTEGDLRAWLDELRALQPEVLAERLNHTWAEDASQRLREYVGGGPLTNYLRARSGQTRESVRATWNALGGTLSASGPGLAIQEEGGVIKPRQGLWLTFRLYQPWDGKEPTGNWVRARQVKIPARHMVRDAATQALDVLGDHLDTILGGLTT